MSQFNETEHDSGSSWLKVIFSVVLLSISIFYLYTMINVNHSAHDLLNSVQESYYQQLKYIEGDYYCPLIKENLSKYEKEMNDFWTGKERKDFSKKVVDLLNFKKELYCQ